MPQGTVEMKTGWLTMEGEPLTEVRPFAQQVRCHPSLHASIQTRNHARGEPIPFSTCAQLLPWHPEVATSTVTVRVSGLHKEFIATSSSGHFTDFPGDQGQTEDRKGQTGPPHLAPEMAPQEPSDNQNETQV